MSLNKIVQDIKSSSKKSKDIALLQRLYGIKVEHYLRAAIERAYRLAAHDTVKTKRGIRSKKYTEQLLNQTTLEPLVDHFTTGKDLNRILALVRKYVDIFWRRIKAFLLQSNTLSNFNNYANSNNFNYVNNNIIKSAFGPALSKLNPNALVTSMGTSAITDTMSEATLSKLDQVGDMNETVRWVTAMDDRVCPICANLDGKEWDINDPDLWHPPDDTHENCRCYLEPVGREPQALEPSLVGYSQ